MMNTEAQTLTGDDVQAVRYAELLAGDALIYETTPQRLMRADLWEDTPVDDATYTQRLAHWQRGQELMQLGYQLRRTPSCQSTKGISWPDDAASPLVFDEAGWVAMTMTYCGWYLTHA